MQNNEELLDDSALQKRLLAPINKELIGLNYWLKTTIGIALIIGGGLLLFLLYLLMEVHYYPKRLKWLMGVSSMIAIALLLLAYAQVKYAQAMEQFVKEETDSALEETTKKEVGSWRNLVILLLIATAPINYMLITDGYDLYVMNSYVPLPMELPIEEFPVEEAMEAPAEE